MVKHHTAAPPPGKDPRLGPVVSGVDWCSPADTGAVMPGPPDPLLLMRVKLDAAGGIVRGRVTVPLSSAVNIRA